MNLLEYFRGDELAANVWLNKYAGEGEQTPDDMHKRMALPLSQEMQKFDPLYSESFVFRLLSKFSSIIPQGSIMAALGLGKIVSLSNCFVVDSPKDSYSGVCHTDAQLPALMKRRGGVGLSLNNLRPRGSKVSNAARSSTGVALFAERYSNTTREVAQDGRRGALMLSLSVKHPDASDFINMKSDLTKVTGANVSLEIEDDFMQAVIKDEHFLQTWPCDMPLTESDYNVIGQKIMLDSYEDGQLIQFSDSPLRYARLVKAEDLYDEVIRNAWANAEPGQMFMTRMWEHSPDGVYSMYKVLSTNPCGEIGMGAYDACRLVAYNLMSAVRWLGQPWGSSAVLDLQKVEEEFYHLQVMADAIVTLEIQQIDKILAKIMTDPEPMEIKRPELDLWRKIRDTAEASRRTGSGYTALGDVFAALEITYGSQESLDLTKDIHKAMLRGCLSASIDLAKRFGPFKGWDPTIEDNSYFTMLKEEFPDLWEQMQISGRRNVSWSTAAPTGTTSLMAQCTSGIEPIFMGFYKRRKKINPTDPASRVDFKDQNGDCWMEFPVIHPPLKVWLEARDFDTSDPQAVENGFKLSPWYGSEANNINWEQRVALQGIAQRYISHSISSTINLPNSATQEDVKTIYLKAWELGLKGVTVYRDGCRTGVLVSSTNQSTSGSHFKRPHSLPGTLFHVTALGRRWTIIVGLRDGSPIEVFASTVVFGTHKSDVDVVRAKKRHYRVMQGDIVLIENVVETNTGEEAALAKMISGALRHGMGVEYVEKILSENEGAIVSFSKAMARTLRRFITKKLSCSECGGTNVVFEEGCSKCLECGYSKCS